MEDLCREIIQALGNKEKVALATVVNREGSAPRAIGAKYLVREDGSAFGSVGGGRVEAEVWQEARDTVRNGKMKMLHFNLTSEQLAEGGSICGGKVDILVEPLREELLSIYREVLRIRQRGGEAVLVTIISLHDSFPKGEQSKILLRYGEERIGRLPPELVSEEMLLQEGRKALDKNKPGIIVLGPRQKRIEILLEPIYSQPTIYLFGGGHISSHVSPLAKRVHFKVVVIDDRETFASPERFPEADKVIVSNFETCFEQLQIDEFSYIVIVTRGHLSDGVVLEQAVKTRARYIGMIGSKRKIKTLYQMLIEKGIAKETLDRVHAPIGLDINSETPEEIAVSIVAELIKVRGKPIP